MTGTLKEAERQTGFDPVAVIDIGSNSVRLIVYEAAKRSPVPLFNEKAWCGLGRSIASSGRLSKDSVDKALRALKRFRAVSDQLGATQLQIIATAAAREAENGKVFIKQAEDICGAPIAVLTGKQEAELAAEGVIAGIHNADGLAADLGGGSLEIIDIKKQKLVGGVTLPLGGLRIIDIARGDRKEAAKFIDSQLAKVDWLERGRDRPFYAIGGTWRAFAKLHMAQTGYPLRVTHAYCLSVADALKFAHLVDHLSPSSLEGIDAISRARRETVPSGALVLERLMTCIKPSKIVMSSFGVREGVLHRLLPKSEQQRDGLIAACEDLAEQRTRSVEHAHELRAWTDKLFEPPGPKETADERRLRHAACLLADIGWRAHQEYRGRESLDTIAHGTFSGVSHADRAFLALAVFYRHEGLVNDHKEPDLLRLVSQEIAKKARIVGAAVRVAHMLSAGMAGVIGNTPLGYKARKLVLHLPPPYNILEGDRLMRRFAALANLLDREPEICFSEELKALEFLRV